MRPWAATSELGIDHFVRSLVLPGQIARPGSDHLARGRDLVESLDDFVGLLVGNTSQMDVLDIAVARRVQKNLTRWTFERRCLFQRLDDLVDFSRACGFDRYLPLMPCISDFRPCIGHDASVRGILAATVDGDL